MLKGFFLSRQWAPWAWGGLLLLCGSIVLEVRILVWLNGWYRELWDFLQTPNSDIRDAISNPYSEWDEELATLAQTNIDKFWGYMREFCWIAFPFILLRAFSGFFAQHYAFRWRQAITFAYMPMWIQVDKDIEGASQRLQQDPEKFARLVESLGLGLFRAILTLVAFIPILWGVSQEIADNYAEVADGLASSPINLPLFEWTAKTVGSLMWVALLLSIGGSILSYFVGIKLPNLEYNNQKVEARFRKPLTYGEDDKQRVNVSMLGELFTGLRFNYFRLYLHYSYFALWSNMFAQFLIIVDLMLIGSGVVLGVITLGFLNQISHAFSKVTDSLSYFVSNWTTVTELMSVVKRLREFERNIGYTGEPINDETLPVQKIH